MQSTSREVRSLAGFRRPNDIEEIPEIVRNDSIGVASRHHARVS